MKKYKRPKAITILCWTAVLFWLILIYTLSDQPATQSSDLSEKITKVIIETVERIAPANFGDYSTVNLVAQFHHLVRKNAHFFIYLVLGILAMNAIKRSGRNSMRLVFLILWICILYAISDEVHQLFVPGRSAQVTDVLIDSAGLIMGIGMYSGVAVLLDKR